MDKNQCWDSRKAAAQALGKLVDVLTKRVIRESGNQCRYPCWSLLFRTAPSLKESDLSHTLSKDRYREMLASRQERIEYLHHELYRQRIPMVMVYEGWDALAKEVIFVGLRKKWIHADMR